jgi:hypothetical protein
MEAWHLMGLSITQYFEEIVFCMGFALNPAVYLLLLSTLHVVLRGADLNASFKEELGKGVLLAMVLLCSLCPLEELSNGVWPAMIPFIVRSAPR